MKGVTRNVDNKKLCTVSSILGLAIVLVVFFVVETYHAPETIADSSIEEVIFSKENHTAFGRKLLAVADDYDDGGGNGNGSMNRIGGACSKENIDVFQGATAPLPNGIPTYTVQVENVCVSGSCIISDIHLSCGWFSSARLINPSVFRRICFDDCIVNNGGPVAPGQTISFQYANTFKYPLSVSSVACN